jgi:hypothetical protein
MRKMKMQQMMVAHFFFRLAAKIPQMAAAFCVWPKGKPNEVSLVSALLLGSTQNGRGEKNLKKSVNRIGEDQHRTNAKA